MIDTEETFLDGAFVATRAAFAEELAKLGLRALAGFVAAQTSNGHTPIGSGASLVMPGASVAAGSGSGNQQASGRGSGGDVAQRKKVIVSWLIRLVVVGGAIAVGWWWSRPTSAQRFVLEEMVSNGVLSKGGRFDSDRFKPGSAALVYIGRDRFDTKGEITPVFAPDVPPRMFEESNETMADLTEQSSGQGGGRGDVSKYIHSSRYSYKLKEKGGDGVVMMSAKADLSPKAQQLWLGLILRITRGKFGDNDARIQMNKGVYLYMADAEAVSEGKPGFVARLPSSLALSAVGGYDQQGREKWANQDVDISGVDPKFSWHEKFTLVAFNQDIDALRNYESAMRITRRMGNKSPVLRELLSAVDVFLSQSISNLTAALPRGNVYEWLSKIRNEAGRAVDGLEKDYEKYKGSRDFEGKDELDMIALNLGVVKYDIKKVLRLTSHFIATCKENGAFSQKGASVSAIEGLESSLSDLNARIDKILAP